MGSFICEEEEGGREVPWVGKNNVTASINCPVHTATAHDQHQHGRQNFVERLHIESQHPGPALAESG